MSMSKKDYNAIARTIRVARSSGDAATVEYIQRELSAHMEADNPAFNADLFTQECERPIVAGGG